MQNCARALHGRCTIDFLPHATVLTLECPAPAPQVVPQVQVAVAPVRNSVMDEPAFHLPENTWCIVVEDSVVQRKLLLRSLLKAGVPSERCLILGKAPEEILDFVEQAQELISKHKEDRFLLIMDEHLDIVEEGGTFVVSKTVSGSCCVQKLREALEPSQESRLLSLIRSANDSRQEQRLYQQRAHGFIPKGPIQHGDLMQVIQPFWQRRFVLQTSAAANTTPQAPLPLRIKKTKQTKLKPVNSDSSSSSGSTMDCFKPQLSMPSVLPSYNSSNSMANACWTSTLKSGAPSSQAPMSLVSVGKHNLLTNHRCRTATANSSLSSISSFSSMASQRACSSSPTLTISHGHGRLFFAKAG
jgi:hypothetical protein